jgi:hypothetical protein
MITPGLEVSTSRRFSTSMSSCESISSSMHIAPMDSASLTACTAAHSALSGKHQICDRFYLHLRPQLHHGCREQLHPILLSYVKLYTLANATKKSELMKRASTIHLYTSAPPLTCDGRRESQHVDTKGGNSNFTINCENQDSNSRPWALIPC